MRGGVRALRRVQTSCRVFLVVFYGQTGGKIVQDDAWSPPAVTPLALLSRTASRCLSVCVWGGGSELLPSHWSKSTGFPFVECCVGWERGSAGAEVSTEPRCHWPDPASGSSLTLEGLRLLRRCWLELEVEVEPRGLSGL